MSMSDDDFKPNLDRIIKESIRQIFCPDKNYCPICDIEISRYEYYCGRCWSKLERRKAKEKL